MLTIMPITFFLWLMWSVVYMKWTKTTEQMPHMDRVQSKKCSRDRTEAVLDRRGPWPGPVLVLNLATILWMCFEIAKYMTHYRRRFNVLLQVHAISRCSFLTKRTRCCRVDLRTRSMMFSAPSTKTSRFVDSLDTSAATSGVISVCVPCADTWVIMMHHSKHEWLTNCFVCLHHKVDGSPIFVGRVWARSWFHY